MYLDSKKDKIVFDVNKLSEEFSCDIKTIMNYISILQDKKLIEIKVIKNDKNITEEYISLDFFYEKVSLNLLDELNKKEEQESDVFEVLEKELGKQLSPIEIEIVKAWKENNYSDEVIKEAIRESVMNGVAGLRYVDKILYEWDKKGIKTKEDVEKNRKAWKEKNSEPVKKEEVFDFDILNLNFETKGYSCKKCPNHCEIIAVKKENKIIDAWGNRCEKGAIF